MKWVLVLCLCVIVCHATCDREEKTEVKKRDDSFTAFNWLMLVAMIVAFMQMEGVSWVVGLGASWLIFHVGLLLIIAAASLCFVCRRRNEEIFT